MRALRWAVGLMLCVGVLAPAVALAGDANGLPPKIGLRAGGEPEGTIGPPGKGLGYNETIAYFETTAPDRTWEYKKNSKVSFSCAIDGIPAGCNSEQDVCCLRVVEFAQRSSRPLDIPRDGYGPFRGEVITPPTLAGGVHTVTVIATDEDGAEASAQSVQVLMDRQPPSAPQFLKLPERTSRDHKPRFRYLSTDDNGFPERTYTSTELFDAQLRRLRPDGPKLSKGDPFGNYLEWRGPYCPTPRECSETDFAAYSADAGHGLSFGVAEWLRPGLYEFSVSATDAVGNESPRSRYRFRILR